MFDVEPVGESLRQALQTRVDTKTKPPGSLGQLECLAIQIGLIQQTEFPAISHPAVVVFAADHGLAAEGVSAFPAEVTGQMVLNFQAGGAAINVFSRQHHLDLRVVDAGVDGDLADCEGIVHRKIRRGTRNALRMAAMTPEECADAMAAGGEMVGELGREGTNLVGLGEMGIGNTSSAALLMALLCRQPIESCVGRGTGLEPDGLAHKLNILRQVHTRVMTEEGDSPTPMAVLRQCGGLEIAMMVGAMLAAASRRMIVLVDGFIATSAALVACAVQPATKDYLIFCHESNEQGHQGMLAYLGAAPLLKLDMRLGEGSGAALAYPLVVSAVAFLNEMASFAEAAVSGRREE